MFFVLQIIELCAKASIVLTVLSVKQYKGCMNKALFMVKSDGFFLGWSHISIPALM